MARMRYSVGDKVLVSRAETGEDHEPGVVVDSYELIIGEERKPMVVVEFEDGERKYLTAATPQRAPRLRGGGRGGGGGGDRARGGRGGRRRPKRTRTLEAHAGGNGEVIFVDDEEGASP